jgi:hypothetical protein
MKYTGTAILVVLALVTAPMAYAQMMDQSSQPQASASGSENQHEFGALTGRIVSIDIEHGTLTLDTGEQLMLTPNFEYTSFPAVGQDVNVDYVVQDGKKVLRSIDVGGEGN